MREIIDTGTTVIAPLDIDAYGRKIVAYDLATPGTIRYLDIRSPGDKTLLLLEGTSSPYKNYFNAKISSDGQVLVAMASTSSSAPYTYDIEVYKYDGEDWSLNTTATIASGADAVYPPLTDLAVSGNGEYFAYAYGADSTDPNDTPTVEIYRNTSGS